MKYLLFLLLIFSLIGCSSSGSSLETDRIFTLDEIKSSGFKMRGNFESEFQGSSESMHGFYKGREVAFIVYPSLDLASTNGLETANEQTEMIEIVEKNIGHGPNVEKLVCRGYKPGVGVAGRGGLKLNQLSESNLGLEGILITNKLQMFSESDNSSNNAPPCVRREPLYTHYKVFGNIVIMAEPLNTEDEKDTTKFVENLASKLLE
mgnify:FL=1|tara:strand:- start:412 stop:1029 length:618 start_codon:yes stop_codon:yes gene_type:complete